MKSNLDTIDRNYEKFYSRINPEKVYPTEFIVRILLADYPNLNFKKPLRGSRVLDIGFGDGRNTTLLCEQGFEVCGTEITAAIVERAHQRLLKLGYNVDFRVGRNSNIPFENEYFDYIVSCHCCYYCDANELFSQNLAEYARVLKTDGFLIASVADTSSYIFKNAIQQPDGSFIIKDDPYGNRNEYRLYGFSNSFQLEDYFSELYKNFSIGHAHNDYFGINEKLFWVVCQKK